MRILAVLLVLAALVSFAGCRKRPMTATYTKADLTEVQWHQDREVLMKTKGVMDLLPKHLPNNLMMLTVFYDERKELYVETQLLKLGYTRERSN